MSFSAFDAAIEALPYGPPGFSHDEPTNADRAERAMRCVRLYEHLAWYNEEADLHDTALGDLLTDIGHLCRRQGIDYEALHVAAVAMTECEVVECEDGDFEREADGWETPS